MTISFDLDVLDLDVVDLDVVDLDDESLEAGTGVVYIANRGLSSTTSSIVSPDRTKVSA
jgi:hypothetical protein